MKTALSNHRCTWLMGKGMKQRTSGYKDTFLGRGSHINLEHCVENVLKNAYSLSTSSQSWRSMYSVKKWCLEAWLACHS